VIRYAAPMTTPTDEELAALGAAFEDFTRRFKLADAIGVEQPLNELDKQTLLYIAEHPGCGPTDLARVLGVPNTTVTSATDRLMKRGLLERERQEGDRRAVALKLSEVGRSRAESFMAAYRELHLRMLEPLTPAERAELLRLITKIVYSEP